MTKNMCDGCLRGLPKQDSMHFSKEGHIDSYCQKDRYVSNGEQELVIKEAEEKGYAEGQHEKLVQLFNLLGLHYKDWEGRSIKEALGVYVSDAVKKERESTATELKQILNRCKTERGLGTAIANFIRTRDNKHE